MWRIFISFPFLLSLFAGVWLGPGNGGILIWVMAGLERFFYVQRVGSTAANGGESAAMSSLHFPATVVLMLMVGWVLFPWEMLPEGTVDRQYLPAEPSPFSVNWLERAGMNTDPLADPMENPRG